MKKPETRLNTRYDLYDLDVVSEYRIIDPSLPSFPATEEPPDGSQPALSAVVHNISRGGLCISVEAADLDVGREISLVLNVPEDRAGRPALKLECVARVVWISEEPAGFRAGLHFTELPPDFPALFRALVERVRASAGVS